MARSALYIYADESSDADHRRDFSSGSADDSCDALHKDETCSVYGTTTSDADPVDALSSGAEDESSDTDRKDELFSVYGGDSSDFGDGFSPAAPIDRRLYPETSGLTLRDSLLADAWERKRELALQDEASSDIKELAKPHLLGRSLSDCSPLPTMLTNHELLKRSISDVGDRGSPMLAVGRRMRDLTDDDFEELKGCIDLGFCFDETSHVAFGQTLPALEVYCAVAQNLQESPNKPSRECSPLKFSGSVSLTSPWRVSSPGDTPEEVKGRLRHWAQAVACNAKLCC